MMQRIKISDLMDISDLSNPVCTPRRPVCLPECPLCLPKWPVCLSKHTVYLPATHCRKVLFSSPQSHLLSCKSLRLLRAGCATNLKCRWAVLLNYKAELECNCLHWLAKRGLSSLARYAPHIRASLYDNPTG